MSEKEKMLAGELYEGRSPELLARYWTARELLMRLNGPAVTDPGLRAQVLKALLGGIGARSWVESPFMCDYGENIFLGDDVYVGYNCIFQDDNRISIGVGTLIGAGTILSAPVHPIEPDARMVPDGQGGLRYRTQTKPVTIGARCWLGVGVRVLPGVTVGDGCVVGAGSVVTHNLPPMTVCAGVPCRVLREVRPKG